MNDNVAFIERISNTLSFASDAQRTRLTCSVITFITRLSNEGDMQPSGLKTYSIWTGARGEERRLLTVLVPRF